MDTQALRAFLAVAQARSFSQAADSLHLTQSAVSKRIQQLESQLGQALFERHNRTISLSHYGEALLPKARQILDLIADTELSLNNLSGEVSGKLSLACSHHIGLHRLPPILRSFSKRYPEVELELVFLGSERAYQAIAQRDVELALTTLKPQAASSVKNTDEQINSILVWLDQMSCVCASNHSLCNESNLGFAQLAQTAAILPEPGTTTHDLIAQAFQQQQLQLNAPMPTNYLETIKMMVSVGLGWSVLPDSMLEHELASGTLKRLNWPGPTLTRQLGLLTLNQRPLSNAARALQQMLLSAADNA